ncbi:MAG TPA: hypothetical protein VIP77_19435 [Jiangellaceae bacterium]
MSEINSPVPPPPPELPPEPPRHKRRWLAPTIVGAVVAPLAFLAGLIAAQDGKPETTAESSSTSQSGAAEPSTEPADDPAPAPPPPPPAPTYGEPEIADFALTVYETERKCFGSAGCHVNFTIDLTNLSTKDFDPAKTYDLRYQVTGGEDEYLSTLELNGDTYQNHEEFLTVPGEGDKLTATVLDIRER